MLECSLFEFSGLLFSSLINSIPHKWGTQTFRRWRKNISKNLLILYSPFQDSVSRPPYPCRPYFLCIFTPKRDGAVIFIPAPPWSPESPWQLTDKAITKPFKTARAGKRKWGILNISGKVTWANWCVYPLISTSFKINHIKWINDVRIPDMISRNNYYGNLYSSPGCLIMFSSVLSQSRVGGESGAHIWRLLSWLR